MGRTKAQPTRKPLIPTIVGAAAHAALASPSSEASSALFHYSGEQDEGALKPATTAVSLLPSYSTPHGSSPTTAVIVTATKLDQNDATVKRKKKRRRIGGAGGGGVSNNRYDSDDDSKLLFDSSATKSMSSSGRRVIDHDGDECADTTSNGGHLGVKRRVIVDDDEDLQSIITDDINGVTLISIPSSSKKIVFSPNAYELVRFHLQNTKIRYVGGEDTQDAHAISLTTTDAAERILIHCNQFLNSEKALNLSTILCTVEEGMMDVVVKDSASDPSSVDVSIRILTSVFVELMSTASSQSPPIRIPRKVPGNGTRAGFTKPHPSYTILRALGGVFQGSIFDNVASSLSSTQRMKDRIDFITAKMVYSVVDNVHANEFEGDKAATASSSLAIPGLVPTLRPYQEAAVRWMLRREGKFDGGNTSDNDHSEWELCWYVVIECPATKGVKDTSVITQSNVMPLPEWRKRKSSHDERHIFCNPFAGWIATSYDESKRMMLGNSKHPQLKGGILAESMGLGKSVELLACILANPSPESTSTTSHPLHRSGAELGASSANNTFLSNDQNCQTAVGNTAQKPRKKVAKPFTIRDAVCMCERSTSYEGCLSWVVCRKCGEAMHGRCAGFEHEEDLISKTEEDSGHIIRQCPETHCPSCVATAISRNQSVIIESRATLIVTPPAIIMQWQREIARHTRNPSTSKPLKVVIYPGVKELCSAESSAPHKRFDLVHPRVLADADVVLLSFQTLMSELGHSSDNPFAGFGGRQGCRLRSKKRYRVLPSPLTSVKWWRVCLDEAQRVETPTAASAIMAQKLITDKRWCVSGTPIGRGRLDDLYGLLLFLSFKPFEDKKWFSCSFNLSHGGAMNRLFHLLQDLMWRSTKANQSVRQQMQIPEMEEKKVKLKLSSVERYFYDQLFEATLELAENAMTSTKNSVLLNKSLHKLRAACCHPQVGASGIGGRVRRQQGLSIAERVLSMDQILEKLIDGSKTKCEEAQRIAILHTVALASLTRLQAEVAENDVELLRKSMKLYQEALDLADANSSPMEVTGAAILSGSVGFCMNQQTTKDGAATLEWQMKADFEKVWCSMSFVGTSRAVSCVSVETCCTLPDELQSVAGSWVILRPKDIILQVSSATAGGAFVDVCCFSVDFQGRKSLTSSFYAQKSKACRFVVKSYHNNPATSKPLGLKSSSPRYYTGLKVQLYEPETMPDRLQQLHVIHNAIILCTTLATRTRDKANSNLLKSMERKGKAILDNYLGHARAIHHESQHQLHSIARTLEKYDNQLKVLSIESNRPWYEDALAWFALNGNAQDRAGLCLAVHQSLANFYENRGQDFLVSDLDRGGMMLPGGKKATLNGGKATLNRRGKFPNYNTLDGLLFALKMRVQQGEDEVGLRRGMDQRTCVKKVMDLSTAPTEGEVFMNSHCRRCRSDWNQKGPVCSHCQLEEEIVTFQRLSNDPEISCVLKTIYKFISDHISNSDLDFLHQRASAFFALQGKLHDEINAAKRLWRAHFELLSDVDELNQCKRAMRLQNYGEDVSGLEEAEAAFIVHPTNVPVEIMEHESKQATALAMLRRNKEQAKYLKNKRLERKMDARATHHPSDKNRSVKSTETCTVCLAGFDSERSVLPCGHFFHPACVDRLFKRSGGTTLRCPMRCPAVVKPQDVLLASEKSNRNGSKTAHDINGDWGTKVNYLIGDVMDAQHMGDKGVIFSQWDEMLDIVATALEANQISFVRPKSGKQFGKDIKKFRSNNASILLMNVKNGAEGLTLTEANHVFMLEPILNCGLDAQAINRIHRIGQSSKSHVHRYIVSNTVEEKIDQIRMEREEHLFEDDTREQKKHPIKSGGIDGGLDLQELHQLFGRANSPT